MSKLLDKIEYHEHNMKGSTIVLFVAPLIGLICDHFGVEVWSYIFCIETIGFMVLLCSIQRVQMLRSIRGTNINE